MRDRHEKRVRKTKRQEGLNNDENEGQLERVKEIRNKRRGGKKRTRQREMERKTHLVKKTEGTEKKMNSQEEA